MKCTIFYMNGHSEHMNDTFLKNYFFQTRYSSHYFFGKNGFRVSPSGWLVRWMKRCPCFPDDNTLQFSPYGWRSCTHKSKCSMPPPAIGLSVERSRGSLRCFAILFVKLHSIHKYKAVYFLAWKVNIYQPRVEFREERTETPPFGWAHVEAWVWNAGEKPSVQKYWSERYRCFGRNSNTSFFGKHEILCFVRNKIFSLMNVFGRTILITVLQPRATLLRRLPWANIFRPFRTKNPNSIIPCYLKRYE